MIEPLPTPGMEPPKEGELIGKLTMNTAEEVRDKLNEVIAEINALTERVKANESAFFNHLSVIDLDKDPERRHDG